MENILESKPDITDLILPSIDEKQMRKKKSFVGVPIKEARMQRNKTNLSLGKNPY